MIRPYLTPCLLLLATMSLSGCISWVTPNVESSITDLKDGEYKLDPNHAALIFKIEHLGLSTYVGRFNQFDASLNFSPKNMTDAQLEAIVEINSIDVNNSKLEKTLQNTTWFNSEQFPQAHFISETVTPISENQFNFNGQLTLRGVTKPVTFSATFHGGADNWMTGKYTLGFSAKGKINRSDFEMSSYIPMVGDEIELEIYAEFLKQ
ncbi:YceI family protein [Shewanella gaetbuli]